MPCASGSGWRCRQWSLRRKTTRLFLAMNSFLAVNTDPEALAAWFTAPAARGRSRHIGPRVERRLRGDDDVRAGFHGLLEHRHRRHGSGHDSLDDGGRVAGLHGINRVGFPLDADVLLDALDHFPGRDRCCPGQSPGTCERCSGCRGGEGGEFAPGKVSHRAYYPRPMNGIFVAITVRNWTFTSSGRPAM